MEKASNTKIKFHTTLLAEKKTATGIQVPSEVIERLGTGKKPPVKATINGYTYRSTIATMGSVFMLPVSAAVRAEAGITAGDELDVELELDNEVREAVLHPEFKKALDADADAKKVFESLSYSKKQAFTLPIGETKVEETRLRRIEKAIAQLKGPRP